MVPHSSCNSFANLKNCFTSAHEIAHLNGIFLLQSGVTPKTQCHAAQGVPAQNQTFLSLLVIIKVRNTSS